MYSNMAAFSAGVIILYCSGVLLSWPAYPVFLVLSFLLPRSWVKVSRIAFWFALGLAWSAIVAHNHIDKILPKKLEGVLLEVQGYICSLSYERVHYSQVEFCALRIQNRASGAEIQGERRLFLSWPNSLKIDLLQNTHHLQVKLKRPHGTVNLVGSSYEQFLFQRRIVATGAIASTSANAPVVDLSLSHQLRRDIVLWRSRLSVFLDSQLHDLEHAGLLKALILGDKSDISIDDTNALKQTGTQHLVAISGLHVGVILLFLYHFLPKSGVTLLLIAVTGLGYVTLVGFSTSAQRAWLMCVVAMISVGGYRKSSFRYPFLLALAMVLMLDPLSPLGLGFWFSFLCVALLLLLAWQQIGMHSVWFGFVVVQMVLFIGLVPVNAYFGLPFSVSNGLANLVTIPWVSLVVLPGALITSMLTFVDTDFARSLFTVLNEVLHVMMTFLSSLQSIGVQLKSGREPTIMLALFAALLGGLFLSRIKGLLICLVLSLALYFWVPSRVNHEEYKLLVFDAGQGLAVLIQAADQAWLYDTGAAYERSSVAENTILPYLRVHNITDNVAGMVISHGDWDHAGGVEYLLPKLMPKQVWSGEVKRLNSEYPMLDCIQGMYWSSRSARIEVLYPQENRHDSVAKISSNNRSCVLRATIGTNTFLLMGDREGKGEKNFLKEYQGDISADVLIAGHHGSNNATSYALLKRVKPKVVIFSAGYRNRFGHPHPKVIERVKVFGADIYNTAEDGAIMISVMVDEPDQWSISTSRDDQSPFWLLSENNN